MAHCAYLRVCVGMWVYVCRAYKYENHVKLSERETKRGEAHSGNDSIESKDELQVAHFGEDPTNVALMQHCDRLSAQPLVA